MPVLTMPKKEVPGVVGIPSDVKEEANRVDFTPNSFILAIETKGYRLAWARSTHCPCMPVNDQTQQPDPSCALCKGQGFIQFRPTAVAVDEDKIGPLDSLQNLILTRESAFAIRGIMTGIGNTYRAYDPIGPRLEGLLAVTVRHENRLGYYDLLVNLDAVVVYSQTVEVKTGGAVPLRYLARQINYIRSVDQVYAEKTHYTLVDGEVAWVTGQAPDAGTRLVVHYLTHPYWRIMEHPHATRVTPIRKKSKFNTETDLPVSGVAKLEFLIG